MTTLKIISLLTFLLISVYAKSQSKLEIEIKNLRNDQGVVMLQLLDQNHVAVAQAKGNIQNKKCSVTIDNLKDSKYAIQYFHDENLNGKLDTNWMKIPKEGYGFSNNAYGNFGPKSFDNWIFEIKADTKIVLVTKYH
jgi:uncharacterized protein (DUF2141 family)